MANFAGGQIGVFGFLEKSNPFVAATSLNGLIVVLTTFEYAGMTLGFAQRNPYSTYLGAASFAHLAKKDLEWFFAGCGIGLFQRNPWSFHFVAQSNNALVYKPTGYQVDLARLMVNVEDRSTRQNFGTGISGFVDYAFTNIPDREVFYNLADPIPTVDSVMDIHWRGTSSSNNAAVFIEYRKKGDNSVPYRDIYESQSFVVSPDGSTTVFPTFAWEAVAPVDPLETIAYRLLIASDPYMKNVLHTIETSNLSVSNVELATGYNYYWTVIAIDSYGGESSPSPVRSISCYQYDPSFVTVLDGVKRILIPFSQGHYSWNISNLPEGEYNYSLVKYTGTQSVIIDRGTRSFIVDHTALNPPEVINVRYDETTKRLNWTVRLHDSLHRRYNIKAIYWTDQRDKLIGAEEGFYFSDHEWHSIPINLVDGSKRELSSNPFLEDKGVFTWQYIGQKDAAKQYTYQLQVMAGPQAVMKPFKWAYRNRVNGVPGAWVEHQFDYEDEDAWTKTSFPVTEQNLEEVLAIPTYFGKANPTGIVMNKTRFLFEGSEEADNVFDFRIYETDVNAPLIQKEGVESDRVIITPAEFYQAGITNLLLDLTNIEVETYPLRQIEIEKIKQQLGSLDFYWQVRTFDSIELSDWSQVEKSRAYNEHDFSWYTETDPAFGASDFYVIRVEVELAREKFAFEMPIFSWMAVINQQLQQYWSEIDRIQKEVLPKQIAPEVIAYYNRQVDVFKTLCRITREQIFNKLVSRYNLPNVAELYAKGVTDGRPGTSLLDFEINDIRTEEEILAALNIYTGEYQWSTAHYVLQLDKQNAGYASQAGRPLREIRHRGRACHNKRYSKCFKTTGDPHSCPWIGKLCPGIKGVAEADIDATEVIFQTGGSAEIVIDPSTELELYFDPGTCPMYNGGPCAKEGVLELDMHQEECEVCGEPRYLEFLGLEDNAGHEAHTNQFSEISPPGFAFVTVTSGGNELNAWGPIVPRGQVRNPLKTGISYVLTRYQLPGENNGDLLDTENEKPLANSYFRYKTLGSVLSLFDPTIAAGQWYLDQAQPGSKVHIGEVF